METLKSLMKKSSICSTKRLYDVETVISETAKHSVKVEYIIRDLIFKKLNNVITDQELTDTVMHIYDDDDSIKGHAKVLRSEELLACLNRYFSSEKRIPAEAPESILDIYDVDVDVNPDALFINGEKIEVVDIPVGYTHNIENLGDTDMVTIMWCNECFNPEKPDTYFLEV